MIGYISRAKSSDNSIIDEKDRVLCQIGCSDKDEFICDWNPNLLNCEVCNKQLTFLMQIVKNVAENTNVVFYIFFCPNVESKCAFSTQGWKIFRNSPTTPTFIKFPNHLPVTSIKFRHISRVANRSNSNSREKILITKYNQRKDDDEWAADEGDQGWIGETYERDKYKEFIKLQDEIARDPQQVIRYADQPLLIERLPKLPNCPACHSQLIFVFQLLPTLGYHLSKHRKLTEYCTDALCNNLLVFSCPNSCIGQSVDSVVREHSILQIEF